MGREKRGFLFSIVVSSISFFFVMLETVEDVSFS